MPSRLLVWTFCLSVSAVIVGMVSCAKAPTVCTTSPVAIEEMKSDIRDLEAQMAAASERLREEQARLADRQAEADSLRSQIPALVQELERAKKASGKTFKNEDDVGQSQADGR